MSKIIAALVATGTFVASVFASTAGEMRADEARKFVVDNLFSFSCFEGTSGEGRVHADGSVVGAIRLGGTETTRYGRLPSGTLRVSGDAICAFLRGMPFEVASILSALTPKAFGAPWLD
jgi:hypothetical protein